MPKVHASKKPSIPALSRAQPVAGRASGNVCGGPPRSRLSLSELRRAYTWLRQLGWPQRFPIVQFPNAPLIIAFLAGQAATHAHGATHAYAYGISFIAMGIWAYEELVHGVNWFRHLLGLGYTISTVVHLALALQR